MPPSARPRSVPPSSGVARRAGRRGASRRAAPRRRAGSRRARRARRRRSADTPGASRRARSQPRTPPATPNATIRRRRAPSRRSSGTSPGARPPSRPRSLNDSKRCAIDSRSSSISSRKRESRSELAVEHRVDDVRDVVLPRRQLLAHRRRESSRSDDGLRAEPPPDRPLGRGRLRLVDAAPDEVEERRRELVRPGLAALAQERRDERGLRVGRGLLLVLAVVARPALAPEDPEDGADDRERGERGASAASTPAVRSGMRDPVVDAVRSLLVALGVGQLLRDDPVEAVPAARPACRSST